MMLGSSNIIICSLGFLELLMMMLFRSTIQFLGHDLTRILDHGSECAPGGGSIRRRRRRGIGSIRP